MRYNMCAHSTTQWQRKNQFALPRTIVDSPFCENSNRVCGELLHVHFEWSATLSILYDFSRFITFFFSFFFAFRVRSKSLPATGSRHEHEIASPCHYEATTKFPPVASSPLHLMTTYEVPQQYQVFLGPTHSLYHKWVRVQQLFNTKIAQVTAVSLYFKLFQPKSTKTNYFKKKKNQRLYPCRAAIS